METFKFKIIHDKDGMCQYRKKEFQEDLPELIKTVALFMARGILLSKEDELVGDNDCYSITSRVFYTNGLIVFYVDNLKEKEYV